MKRQAGLTLLEVLIAVMVFSLIAIAGYRVLSATLILSERTTEAAKARQLIDRMVFTLRSDLEQLVDRPVTRGLEREQPALAFANATPGVDAFLEFTRAGNNVAALHHSSLQRVRYQWSAHPDNRLSGSPWFGDSRRHWMRLTWRGLDVASDKPDQIDVLLEDVPNPEILAGGASANYRNWPLPLPPERRPPLSELRFLQVSMAPEAVGEFVVRVALH